MRAKKFSEEVLYTEDDLCAVDSDSIDFLKEQALGTTRERMRICAHKDVSDTLHEMIIVHHKGAFVRPHKHLGKIESCHIIEGEVDLIVYDDEGEVTDVVRMGDYASGKTFYHRMSEPRFHTLLIHSDVLVFHEITNGPFEQSATEFPTWAPAENDLDGVRRFMEGLARLV
jgi:cupin fold WbuC family metalloprotein